MEPSTNPPHIDPLLRWGVLGALLVGILLPATAALQLGTTVNMLLATGGALWTIGPATMAFLLPTTLPKPQRRALWLATAPALSLAALMLLTLAQTLLGWWAPQATAMLIGASTAALSLAWLRHSTAATTLREWAIETAACLPSPIARRGWGITALTSAASLLLWVISTRWIDLDAAADTGLIGVLPPTYYAALACALLGFALALRRTPLPTGQLTVTLLPLVLLFTLTVNIADHGAVMGTGYLHEGFARLIHDRGALASSVDARFSWPGFFTAAAALFAWADPLGTGLGAGAGAGAGVGAGTSLSATTSHLFVLLHPAIITAAYLPGIITLGWAVTRSARTGWIAAVLFLCINWGQQEYFSPQSTALLLYLAIVCVLFVQLRQRISAPLSPDAILPHPTEPQTDSWWRWPLRRVPAPAGWGARRLLAMEAVLLVMGAALVCSHQLTPVALIVALAGLAAAGLTYHRTLWFGVGLLFAAWFAFGAVDWWQGHLNVLTGDLGRPGQALSSGIAARTSGSQVYQVMQQFRIVWSAVVALAAALGWVLAWRRFPPLAGAIMVAAPVSLVVGQSYGGEIVLRVFLYASPLLAVLAAWVVRRLLRIRSSHPAPTGGRASAFALAAVLLVAGIAGSAARGVNASFERTPADVLAAADRLLQRAPAGTTVRPLATEGSLRSSRVLELHHPGEVNREGQSPVQNLLEQSPDFVFLTTMRESYEHIVRGNPANWYGDIARQLEDSGRYRIVERSRHVIVLERITGHGLLISEDPGLPAPTGQGLPSPTDQGLPTPTDQGLPTPTGRDLPAPTDQGGDR